MMNHLSHVNELTAAFDAELHTSTEAWDWPGVDGSPRIADLMTGCPERDPPPPRLADPSRTSWSRWPLPGSTARGTTPSAQALPSELHECYLLAGPKRIRGPLQASAFFSSVDAYHE
jgi:hypothetical protein